MFEIAYYLHWQESWNSGAVTASITLIWHWSHTIVLETLQDLGVACDEKDRRVPCSLVESLPLEDIAACSVCGFPKQCNRES